MACASGSLRGSYAVSIHAPATYTSFLGPRAMVLKAFAKKVASVMFGGYRLNRIYTFDLAEIQSGGTVDAELRRFSDPAVMEASRDARMRDHSWFAGPNAYCFGLWVDGELACSCIYWNQHRFTDTKIWSIGSDEVAMVDLLTVPGYRGRGYASALVRHTQRELSSLGFKRLVTWVWHTNTPSIATFDNTGWRYVAFVMEVFPFGLHRSIRLCFRKRPHRH